MLQVRWTETNFTSVPFNKRLIDDQSKPAALVWMEPNGCEIARRDLKSVAVPPHTRQIAITQTESPQKPSCEILERQIWDLNFTDRFSLTCISLNVNPTISFVAGDSRNLLVVGPNFLFDMHLAEHESSNFVRGW